MQENLPETVRLTKERVLKLLQKELAKKLEDKRNQKLSKKYRMVKFFGKCVDKLAIIALMICMAMICRKS